MRISAATSVSSVGHIHAGQELRAGPRRLRRPAAPAKSRDAFWVTVAFLWSLTIPWMVDIGPLRMSVYRLGLTAMVLPCLVIWASGKAGRARVADIALLLFCFWCFISLAVVHGLEYSLQSAGMTFIETMGPYLLARCFVRNAEDFHRMVRALFLIVLLLLPFAAYESLTGRNLLLRVFALILPSFPDHTMQPRWGLWRAQTVFEHPILFGVFCCAAFTLTHTVLGYGASTANRWKRTGLVGIATFFSLSSGPISAMAIQALLIFWNWLLRGVEARWKILCAIIASVYSTIALLSNQGFFEFYVHYFAFSQDTGWDRIHIWRYGTASVAAHPLFGIGYYDYVRPEWMEASIDMFWLINFVRFGIPGGFLMLLAFWSVCLSLGLKRGLDDRLSEYRMAHLITMAGIFVAGWTVHFWFAVYVLFLFLLGSGVWMLDAEPEGAASPAPARDRHSRAAPYRARRPSPPVPTGAGSR